MVVVAEEVVVVSCRRSTCSSSRNVVLESKEVIGCGVCVLCLMEVIYVFDAHIT